MLKKKEVKTGESDGKMIVIASDLPEGEEVVIAGQENLEENTKVNVRNRKKNKSLPGLVRVGKGFID